MRRGLAEPYLTGSAEWKVFAPRGGPSLLPVEPLSVAPRQVRFENGEAWLGNFDGRRPSLLLEKPGHQAVLFDWTARGETTPDGLHFDIRVPLAPVSVLELELPAGRSITVAPGDCLVTPGESDAPGAAPL